MRVLHLTRDFPPHSAGGTSTAVGTLVEELAQKGVASEVISFDHWRGRAGGGDNVEHRPGETVVLRISSGHPYAAIADAARLLRPTVVHLHHENLWAFAERLRSEFGVPVVYSVHTLQQHPREGEPSPISTDDQRTALTAADAVTVPSRFAAERVSPVTPPSTPLHIASNVLPVQLTRARQLTDPPLVTYVGRFDWSKGTDTLFEIMRIVLERCVDIRFAVAGGLPASAKRERRWLRRWHASAPAIADRRVRFLGWLGPAELDELYRASSLQLVPSRCETFGLSAAEAMSRGIPVVAGRSGALTELIEHGITGILCDQDDAAAQATAILDLCRDPTRALAIGELAARSIEARYSPEAALPAWLSAYRGDPATGDHSSKSQLARRATRTESRSGR